MSGGRHRFYFVGSFHALQQYCLQNLAFTYPEGELRQQYTTTPEGRVGQERDFPGSARMLEGMKKYTDIPVPALVIFAIPHAQGKWVDDSTDPRCVRLPRLIPQRNWL